MFHEDFLSIIGTNTVLDIEVHVCNKYSKVDVANALMNVVLHKVSSKVSYCLIVHGWFNYQGKHFRGIFHM